MRSTYLRLLVVAAIVIVAVVAWKEITVAPGPGTPTENGDEQEMNERDRAMQAVLALKRRDMEEFASIVHPEKGVKFFPYTYVEPATVEAIPTDVVARFPTMSSVRTWGIADGSGEPIVLPYMQYVDRYVYDRDFALAEDIRENDMTSQGNAPNNVVASFPDTTVVSFHLPPENPDYGGMDWKNLRLVMEEKDSVWYVIAVVHDEWTI